jgi:hypothetical protein
MAKEKTPKRIDISRIPELLRMVQEVRSTNESAVLQQEREDLAILSPIRPKKSSKTKAQPVTGNDALFRLTGIGKGGRGKPTSADDPLWKLVGIGHSGKGDISENTHKYLAEAHLHHKQA